MQGFVPDGDEDTLRSMVKDSKTFELYGRVNLLNLNRLLLTGVSLSLRLNMENQDFIFIENKESSKLKLLDAKLHIRHVLPRDELMLSIERRLLSSNAVYEFKRGEIYTQNIASTTSNLNLPNFYVGPKPSLVIYTQIDNQAFSSKRSKDPFVFEPFELNSFQFTVNGVAKPQTRLEFKMTDDEQSYAYLFGKIIEALGLHNEDRNTTITMENFKTSRFFIVDDISAFGYGTSDIGNFNEQCTIGVSGTYAKPLKSTVTAMLYVLVGGRFEITSHRNVLMIQ